MSDSRRPDYELKAWHKTSNASGEVGAAWNNEDGSLSLVLNPGCMLMFDPEIKLRLFPNEYKNKETNPTTPGKSKNIDGTLAPF